MPNVVEAIHAHLSTKKFGQKIHYFDKVDSTNEEALKLAANGAQEGDVVITDQQTSGKGRSGRHWFSPPDRNIYMSLILRPPCSPQEAVKLTTVAGVAIAKTLRNITGKKIDVKWPNDIWANGKKLGGILTEARTQGGKDVTVILGIGIDVNIAGDEFPEELRRVATSLKELTGESLDRNEVIASLLQALEDWYDKFCAGQWKDIVEWSDQENVLKNKRVRITTGGREFTGRANGLDEDGYLVVTSDEGETAHFMEGDTQILADV